MFVGGKTRTQVVIALCTLKQWFSASGVPKVHLKNFKYIYVYVFPLPFQNIQGQGVFDIFKSPIGI